MVQTYFHRLRFLSLIPNIKPQYGHWNSFALGADLGAGGKSNSGASGFDEAALEDAIEGAGRDKTLLRVSAVAVVVESALSIASPLRSVAGSEGPPLCDECDDWANCKPE